MDSILNAIILGIIEGLTEFLPVSSTGHLILANHFMGLTGEKIATFDVVIQLGAILAVVLIYRDRFWGLLGTDPAREFSGPRGIWLLLLTTIPACVFGLLAHSAIKEYLFGPTTVIAALAVGAVLIFVVEALPLSKRVSGLDGMTPGLALGIGFFQCLALWPGFSRSAATIMGGMILGVSRKTAAEYSFIAAVPVMVAATGYDMLKSWRLFEASDFLFLAVGFVVSFFSAWAAIRGFIALLSRLTLRSFAVYRLALAGVVFLVL